MATTRMKFAQLDDSGLEKVHSLEEQTSSVVLVMERIYPVAKLTDEQVNRLKILEDELGVILIALQR
jgi:hypothetical protein